MRPMALSCSFFMVLALGAVTVSTVRADDNHTMPSLASTIEGFKRKLGMNVDPSEFLHHLQGGLNTMSENYLVVPFWDLHITTKDGITLIASAFVPIRWTFEPLPVVIFPNSWSLPYLEYTSRALSIASRGYIVVQYQTRGFWFSGGIVDTAGPLDLSDGSDVIDYVLSQWTWRPLKDKIAFCGISYGAGISFLMGGYDARVTTVIPMSGWANLTEMAYARQTPSTMVNALISMGGWTGRLPPALPQMLKDLISHTNMADAVAYSNPRSPQKFLDAMNARKLPVLIFNNYWDELFRPQTMLTLFRKLQGPKKLVLNEGSHAIPEAKGLFAASYVWDRTQDWLDLWLKGVKTNNVMALPEVQTELGPSVGVASPNYLPFSNWRHSTKKLFLTPRGSSGLGSLAPAAPTSSTEKSIQFTPTPPFNAGFNNESGMDAGKPYMVQLTGQDQATSVVWQSAPFTAPFNLCGTPTFDLTFRSTHDTWQVFTTLYDVAPGASQGSLLSHGFYSWYPDGPLAAGTPAVKAEDGTWKITGVEFHTMCRTVAAGHSLAVALVLLHSDLFYPANNASDFAVTVAYGAGSFISLPVLAQP